MNSWLEIYHAYFTEKTFKNIKASPICDINSYLTKNGGRIRLIQAAPEHDATYASSRKGKVSSTPYTIPTVTAVSRSKLSKGRLIESRLRSRIVGEREVAESCRAAEQLLSLTGVGILSPPRNAPRDRPTAL